MNTNKIKSHTHTRENHHHSHKISLLRKKERKKERKKMKGIYRTNNLYESTCVHFLSKELWDAKNVNNREQLFGQLDTA